MFFLVVPSAIEVLRKFIPDSLVHHNPDGFEVRDVLPRLDILVAKDTILELMVIANVQGGSDVDTHYAAESFDNGPIVLE